MKNWPELAIAAFKHADRNTLVRQVLNNIELNALTLTKLFIKIDKIFDEVIKTPGELDRRGVFLETDNTIKRRFWIQFFESLAYAVKKHSPRNEQISIKKRAEYTVKLEKATNQAAQLAKTLKELTQHGGLACDGAIYDPLQWIIASLEKEQKNFHNPVYDALEKTQRYDNQRYWPTPDNVIDSLSSSLKNALATSKKAEKIKTPAILEDLKNANWYRDTKYSWHLPSHFMGRFSNAELSLLISTALALSDPQNESTIRSARKEIGCDKP